MLSNEGLLEAVEEELCVGGDAILKPISGKGLSVEYNIQSLEKIHSGWFDRKVRAQCSIGAVDLIFRIKDSHTWVKFGSSEEASACCGLKGRELYTFEA
jgi:hypothetical protein